MVVVDAMGQQCPMPVVMTKEAINKLEDGKGRLEILVDNAIAVQNLGKMADQKGYGFASEKRSEQEYHVYFTVEDSPVVLSPVNPVICQTDCIKNGMVAVIDGDTMGKGDEKLGRALLKSFIFAVTKNDLLPQMMLFYNRGAMLTTEGSESLEDLKTLEAQGVEIMTCGTCMDFYGIKDKLAVGSVTNMYSIVEVMTAAQQLIKP